MAKKSEYVIRVSWRKPEGRTAALHDCVPLLLEQLRYAGVIKLHKEYFFDIAAPQGVTDSTLWASSNAERMSSFGINAVCAPRWEAPCPTST